MIDKKTIQDDHRFFINEETLDYMLKREIYNYKLVEIPVGKIHRYLDKKVYSLYKTDPYIYLQNRENVDNIEMYRKYCERAKGDNSNRSINWFDNLIESFDLNYDPKKGIIVIDQLNCIVEGQHRACILLHKHGEKHKIQVLKIRYAGYGVRAYVLNVLYNMKRIIGMDC